MTVDSRQSFIAAIERHLAAEPDNQELAKSVFAGQSRQPCFIIGKNQQTHDLAKALKIEAIVQDQAQPGSAWEGLRSLASTICRKTASSLTAQPPSARSRSISVCNRSMV